MDPFQFSDKIHARRDYADTIKAADKSNPAVLKNSTAHQVLERIAKFNEEDGKLEEFPPPGTSLKATYYSVNQLN